MNRLRTVLDSVISPCQSALPGGLILDCVILDYESLHKIKSHTNGKKGLCAYKLNMSKAYYPVEWSFLRKMMLSLGFCSKWVDLVMNCVTNEDFFVLINDHPWSLASPKRGLRQGCPLSPYLFLLWFEGLSGLINEAVRIGDLTSLKISRNSPLILHLLFADDCLIFSKATVKL